jgi:putative peptide zinc metalloprotease protein
LVFDVVSSPEPVPPYLATLREDLQLSQGPPLDNGSPTWTLHDPVRNLFFRIGWQEFTMLSHWGTGHPKELAATVNKLTTLTVTTGDVQILYDFLMKNLLIASDNKETLSILKARVNKEKPGIFLWLLKNYLFFRLPLFKPDRFLDATLIYARMFVAKPFLYFLVIIGFLGILLVIRQWEAFSHTFLYFFSTQGLVFYGLAILLSKLFHELGHAYTSKFYGLQVPTMGVAFLILWPVLYSDNSEAWKLKSRTARINIVAAGTLVELALALIATFVWGFLPDGPLRSACFITATVTWVSSLFINMSPFLRFDGYYLLSDLWEMPNLHSRAFALGKWQMRRTLLGLDVVCPENLPPAKRRAVILFAYFTWIYRLILFTGIAVLVYSFFFKLLGILLFTLEIFWFLLLPVTRELKVWWEMRKDVRGNIRVLLLFLVTGGFVLLLFIPVNTKVYTAALMKPGKPYSIYPQVSARLLNVSVSEGSKIRQGDLLFEFESPSLDYAIKRVQIRIEMLTIQLKRFGQKSVLIEEQHILQKQFASAVTELEGYRKQKQLLKIVAPVNGIIKDMSAGLVPGKWVNTNQFMALIVKTGEPVIESYPDEHELARISLSDRARFYPENDRFPPVDCLVQAIDQASSTVLDEPYLASIYGGNIPVRERNNRLLFNQSQYRILLLLDSEETSLPDQVQRGTAIVFCRPESIARRALKKIIAVFIRESSF